jgi:hypothetical protein
MERMLGSKHPHTLNSRNNLGVLYKDKPRKDEVGSDDSSARFSDFKRKNYSSTSSMTLGVFSLDHRRFPKPRIFSLRVLERICFIGSRKGRVISKRTLFETAFRWYLIKPCAG